MLAGLMTATVLGGVAPAYAQRWQEGGRDRGGSEQSGRGDGQQSRDGGRFGQRWEGGSRGDRAAGQRSQERANDRATTQTSPQRADRQWRGGEVRSDGARDAWRNDARVRERSAGDRPQWRDDRRGDNRPGWRDDRVERRPDWRENRPQGRLDSGNNWRGTLAGPRRYDDRTRWSSQRRWDNGWRQDRRYDWRSYRSRYGDRYRIGRYYAPRGWGYGYSRVSVGIFLNSLLFANNYWIDDPWSYRLPPAYGSLRWIRYYDDALLVDVRDGYVVDVIQDFFW